MRSEYYPAQEEHWSRMLPARLLMTLGGIAALVVPLHFLTNSALVGWELLWLIPLAWLGFAFVVGLGAPLSIFAWVVFSILLIPFREDIQEKAFWLIRWAVLIAGSGFLIIGGGIQIIDGWTNNRMQPTQALYDRCMQPVTTIRTQTYEACADGWRSPSIGERGACSHHGGVRTFHEKHAVTEPPHSRDHCLRDSAERSWLD